MSSVKRALSAMALAGALLAAGGCHSVTITQEGDRQLASTPQYEERKNFFLWGLVGEHSVDVVAVCGDGDAAQMQSQLTFVDGLLSLVTLGIYAPRTARVWCRPGGARS